MQAQDEAPVSGVFPADGPLHLLEIGVQAIQLISPYHAGPSARRSIRLDTTTDWLPCCVPFVFRLQVRHRGIRPKNTPPNSSQLSWVYDRALRGASCYCSLRLSSPGKALDPGTSLQVPPG